jgi:hypothetical protein
VVDAGQRLVEEQHRGVLHQRASDQDALALAAGERAEAVVRAVGEPDPRERLAGPLAIGAGDPLEPRRAAVRAHQRDIVRGDREVQARAVGLRHVGRAPGQSDAPGAVRQLAEQGAEERRLSTAVRAEHGRDLARLDAERDAAEHVGATHVPAPEVLSGDGHAGTRRGVRAAAP